MSDEEKILLGVVDLQEGKRLKSALATRNIFLDLVSNPETCSSGKCGSSVELYIDRNHVAVFNEFLAKEKAQLLAGHQLRPGFESEVFDAEKETATCPACGTAFSTKLSECPDCGLGFSVDGSS